MDRPILLTPRSFVARLTWPASLRGVPGMLALVALVYCGLYLWIFLAHPWANNAPQMLSDFGEVPLQIIGLALVISVIFSVHYRRTRQVWVLFGLAIAADMVGNIIYGLYDLAGEQPFPSIADVFYLAFYGFLIAGIVLLPRAPNTATLRWRLWINVLLVLLGGSMVMLHFVFAPMIAQLDNDLLASAISLAYPWPIWPSWPLSAQSCCAGRSSAIAALSACSRSR